MQYHPVANFSTHTGLKWMICLFACDMTDEKAPEKWKFQLFISSMGDNHAELQAMSNRERVAFLQNEAQTLIEPYKSALLWLREDTPIPMDMCTIWKDMVPWENSDGRITLAGDAAHAMS